MPGRSRVGLFPRRACRRRCCKYCESFPLVSQKRVGLGQSVRRLQSPVVEFLLQIPHILQHAAYATGGKAFIGCVHQFEASVVPHQNGFFPPLFQVKGVLTAARSSRPSEYRWGEMKSGSVASNCFKSAVPSSRRPAVHSKSPLSATMDFDAGSRACARSISCTDSARRPTVER